LTTAWAITVWRFGSGYFTSTVTFVILPVKRDFASDPIDSTTAASGRPAVSNVVNWWYPILEPGLPSLLG
jgi:hypothetical protein